MSQIIYLGTVTSVYDESNGGRIRAKIPLDGSKEPVDGYPYAFPLLPKIMQITPKVGEMVVIFLANSDNRNSPRFYVGPIISQPQKMYMDRKLTEDNPACLIGNSLTKPLETTCHFTDTFGSFAKINDVSLSGRKGEDIILRDDEVNIRCGVRNSADGTENVSEVGNILFNNTNPAYIQLKHQRKGGKTDNLINLVGGSINLMSQSDAKAITNGMKNYNNVDVSTSAAYKDFLFRVDSGATKAINELNKLKEEKSTFEEADYDALIAKLHQVPYGDVLVNVLEIIRDAILHHTHKWAQEEPTKENVECMTKLQTWGESTDVSQSVDLGDILLSDTVRIS